MRSKLDSQERKPVGLTAASGFQVGVRRTLPVSQEQAWNLLLSPKGLAYWLGEISELDLRVGQSFQTGEGNFGELKIVKPQQQLRMRWQRKHWMRPSTLQIRLLPKEEGRTTISFHQEQLADIHTREEMKLHWETVLSKLIAMAD